MPPPSPFARPCFPPAPRPPLCARPSSPPSAAPSSSPPCAAATRPPFARPSPLTRAALPRRYADPRSAARRSGIAAPASATAPPLTRLGAACAGGGCPRRWRGCGWNSLAVRSLATRACARWRGQSGPREDRRGSSRRSAALFRPAGFGWGRARRCGTRQPAASPTPPPIRARAFALAHAHRSIRLRRIPNGACPSAPSKAIFRSKSVAFGPMEAPAPQFCPKNGLQRRCKAACNSPRVSRYA